MQVVLYNGISNSSVTITISIIITSTSSSSSSSSNVIECKYKIYFLWFKIHYTHHTTILRPFFWDHSGEPVPKENLWTLWCKRRLTEADTLTIRLGANSIRTNQCPPPPYPHFYRLDALPAAQPTVSKH